MELSYASLLSKEYDAFSGLVEAKMTKGAIDLSFFEPGKEFFFRC